MALLVWLPLNGNIDNQGLSSVEKTAGTPAYKSGKIGQCLDLNSRVTFKCNDLNGCQKFTVMFWVKIEDNSSLATNWQDVFSFTTQNSGNSSAGQFRAETCYAQNQTSNYGVHWHDNTAYNMTDNGSGAPSHYTGNRGIWKHCAVTLDSNSIIGYTDGVQISAHSPGNPGGHLTGQFWLGETNNIAGGINDVRIYDDVLSAAEIKMIARGLVAHFPLSRDGLGCDNLLPPSSSNTYGSASTETTITFTGWDTNSLNLNNNGSTINWNEYVGQYVTYSCWLSNDLQTVGTGTGICIHFIFADSTYQQFWGGKNGLTSVDGFLGQGESGLLWITAKIPDPTTRTNPTTIASVRASIRHNSSTGQSTVTYKLNKVEFGQNRTPWIPHGSDPLYSGIGVNSNVVCDVSGYKNNGAISGTLGYSNDTPRYFVSTVFNKTAMISLTSPCAEVRSVSFFFIWDTIPSGQSVLFLDKKSYIGFGLTSNGILCGVQGPGSFALFSRSNLVADTWYHFVVVNNGALDGLSRKLYINGVEQSTISGGSNWTFALDETQIGRRSTTGDGFSGKMSDLRMYATALSQDDVTELYQTSAVLANNGVLMTNEIIE